MYEERKQNLIRKRAFTLALVYMFFSVCGHINASVEKERNFSYEICEDNARSSNSPYAKYNGYNIYIGSEEYLSSYMNKSENICVLDGRCSKNPNMKIYDSYRITSSEDMFNILGILLDYEKQNPSDWNRTIEGLQIEWVAHNVSYEYGVLPLNSGSVDLDNRDSLLYENDIVKLILGK